MSALTTPSYSSSVKSPNSVKRTCCGGFIIRDGVLLLLSFQAITAGIAALVLAYIAESFFDAVHTEVSDGTTRITVKLPFATTQTLTVSRTFSLSTIRNLLWVTLGLLCFMSVWSGFGYVTAKRRCLRGFQLFYRWGVVVVVIIAGMHSAVPIHWATMSFLILFVYYTWVYHEYSKTMVAEAQERFHLPPNAKDVEAHA